MESSISSLPLQGQGQGDMGSSSLAAGAAAAASSSSSSTTSTSGSIGPFFAVISVLTFLAIASCVVGRICIRRRCQTMTAVPVVVTPLDTIKHGRWLCWLKLKCRHCITAGDVVEVGGGAKVMSLSEDKTNDTHPPQV